MNDKSEFDYATTFPPLGHPEHHFNKYPNHPWLKTKEEISSWIDENIVGIYNGTKVDTKIDDDLTVSFSKVKMKGHKFLEYIPFKIKCVQNLDMAECGLKSLIGMPYKSETIYFNDNLIEGFEGIENSNISCLILTNNQVKSFDFFAINVGKITVLELEGNPIECWKEIDGVDTVLFWQEGWCNESSEKNLDNIPKGINKVLFNSDFVQEIPENLRRKYSKYINGVTFKVREFQSDMMLKENKDNINTALKDGCRAVSKSRKI